MKKKVSSKLLLILLSVFLASQVEARAITYLDHYRNLFFSWNIHVETLQMREDSEEILEIGTKDNLLMLGSQIKEMSQLALAGIKDYKNVFLICDVSEPVNLPHGLVCTNGGFSLNSMNPVEATASYTVSQTLRPTEIEGTVYYIIPQALILTPEYESNTENYFKALARSQRSFGESYLPSGAASFAVFKNSSTLEGSIYALIILVFISVFMKPFVAATKNPKQLLTINVYTDLLERPVVFLSKYSSAIAFVLTILTFLYIPILYTLIVRGEMLGNAKYPLDYILSTLDPQRIPDYIIQQNLPRIGLLFYSYTLFLFAIFLVLPSIVRSIVSSYAVVARVKLRTNIVKWSVPAIVYLSGLLLAFKDLDSLLGLLSFCIVILGALLIYIKAHAINYSSLFSISQRRILFVAAVFVALMNLIYPVYLSKKPTEYRYEPLIGTKNDVILFPYSKQWGDSILFEPFNYTGSSQVFADAYLIYSPEAEKITNKNLKYYKEEENSSIASRETETTLKLLMSHPALINKTTISGFSPLFLLDLSAIDLNDLPTIRAELTFSCDFRTLPGTVKLRSVYPVPIVPYSGITEIFNFPGCKSYSGTETFQVALDPLIFTSNKMFVYVDGIDNVGLVGLKMLAPEKELPITYINKSILDESSYALIPSEGKRMTDVVNYSEGIKDDFSFAIKRGEKGFDISGPINELVKQGLLKNPFVIWTSEPYEIIKQL